jgi:hypothetical protein
MAVDRIIPTSPPSNTTMAYFAQQVQEELTPIWQHVIMDLAAAGVNALTATTTPALTSYADSKYFMMVAPSTNTGPMTLNVDGLGARPVLSGAGTPLAAGAVLAGQAMMLYFDGVAFRAVAGADGAALPNPTQQYQVLQADGALAPQWSLELYGGNF